MDAVIAMHVKAVKYLIEAGAKVNARNSYGGTAIQFARELTNPMLYTTEAIAMQKERDRTFAAMRRMLLKAGAKE